MRKRINTEERIIEQTARLLRLKLAFKYFKGNAAALKILRAWINDCAYSLYRMGA